MPLMLRRMRRCVSVLCLLAVSGPRAESASGQEPEYVPLRGLERALWREERAELWMLCAADESRQVRVFDAWLREREPLPATAMPEGGVRLGADGAAEVELWGNRRLRTAADGSLRLLPLPWESAPRVHWGPGWATVELRCAHPLAALLWRRAGEGELRSARFVADRADGALQRASLYGLTAGERIEVALPELQPAFPPRTELDWRRLAVPVLAPDGRISSAWPSE